MGLLRNANHFIVWIDKFFIFHFSIIQMDTQILFYDEIANHKDIRLAIIYGAWWSETGL